MLRVGLLMIATCVSLAAARRSPNADTVEQWVKEVNVRYSDNVLEDALLDVVSCTFLILFPSELSNQQPRNILCFTKVSSAYA